MLSKCPSVLTIIDYNLKNLKIHEMDAAEYVCSAKHLKNKIDDCVPKFRKNQLQKILQKPLLLILSQLFCNIQRSIFSKHSGNNFCNIWQNI